MRRPPGQVDTTLLTRVRTELAAVADPTKAPGMQAYMKSTMPYLGVLSPVLRATLRRVYDEHPLLDAVTWRATVLELWDDARHREERYAAIALVRHPRYREHLQVSTLDLCRHLVVTGAWWDYVDDIATHLVRDLLLARPEGVSAVLRGWAHAESMWLRRTAILSQVGTRDRCDQQLLREVIEANLDGSTRSRAPLTPYGREFFIRKAIGWALRDHARTDPDWVRSFVADHEDRLAGLSRREALRHLSGPGPTPQP